MTAFHTPFKKERKKQESKSHSSIVRNPLNIDNFPFFPFFILYYWRYHAGLFILVTSFSLLSPFTHTHALLWCNRYKHTHTLFFGIIIIIILIKLLIPVRCGLLMIKSYIYFPTIIIEIVCFENVIENHTILFPTVVGTIWPSLIIIIIIIIHSRPPCDCCVNSRSLKKKIIPELYK